MVIIMKSFSLEPSSIRSTINFLTINSHSVGFNGEKCTTMSVFNRAGRHDPKLHTRLQLGKYDNFLNSSVVNDKNHSSFNINRLSKIENSLKLLKFKLNPGFSHRRVHFGP